jgi:hypothetical protein
MQHQVVQQPQNLLMVQVGQLLATLNTARRAISWMWSTNSIFSFWWSNSNSKFTGATESYNGTSWTTGNSMNTARRISRFGTQTACFRTWWVYGAS